MKPLSQPHLATTVGAIEHSFLDLPNRTASSPTPDVNNSPLTQSYGYTSLMSGMGSGWVAAS